MRALFDRARRARDDESGITLVEVMVAMLVFAIVSMGFVYTMLAVTSLGRDARARQVAANLAAQDIDRTREEDDVFALQDKRYDAVLNGDTFHVARATSWVSDPQLDFACGAGSGTALRYKRVNIRVTWDGMRPGSAPVQADTVIDAKDRINDPTRGTLLVSVLGGDGQGTRDVTVTAQPVNASGTPTGSALPSVQTDAQGCAYVLKVLPGEYRITIAKPGYADIGQNPSPSVRVGVAANATASAAFSYDQAARYTVRYATNVQGVTPRIPTSQSMVTTFLSTYDPVASAPTVDGQTSRTFSLFPVASGYEVFAGTCNLPDSGPADPASWPGGARVGAAAAPGETTAVDVPMGVVHIALGTGPGSNGSYVKAIAVATPPDAESGAPGCATPQTLTFSGAVIDGSGQADIALPYGYWQLYRGSSTSQSTLITANQLQPLTGGSVSPGNVVTLDPRVPQWEAP